MEEVWVLLPEGGEELAKGEDQRLISSTLAVLLGPFGAHRLYLGTTPRVAVIYGLTFGGFGVLALIDLGHLLFTKDLAPYRGSDRVFMWGEGGRGVTPP
ncbi:MAG: TM2 domain-containing protein [Flavobacteriales bacterium]|nr:TM2 domain-containing protein [Flavobacteriales bacterium]